MSRQWGDREFLAALTAPIQPSSEDKERAQFLLTDYLHCVLAGTNQARVSGDALTLAAHLAKASSKHDLDDVNWRLLIHPGSIVNSAIVALFLTRDLPSTALLPAMLTGYSAAAVTAEIFESSNGAKWHATATSGIFGATCASARLLELDEVTTASALKLASAAIGGGANAAISRNGATRFTRIHATVMGILAALEAADGAPAPDTAIDGIGGLATRFELRDQLPNGAAADAIAEISLRFYPWSGFSHGALTALKAALPIDSNLIKSVLIKVPTRIFPLVGSDAKGPWWSIAAAIQSTLLTGDPMVKNPSPSGFSITTVDSGSSEGSIEIEIDGRVDAIPFGMPTDSGIASADTESITRKWESLAGASSQEVSELVRRLLVVKPDNEVRGDLAELLQISR